MDCFFFKYEKTMINDIYQFFTFIFTRRPKSRFLPLDAMRKRGFAVARYLSVRLSVTFVYCIQTAEDIVKLLSRLGSPIILVFFLPRAPVPSSKGNPFSGGAKYTGGICDY